MIDYLFLQHEIHINPIIKFKKYILENFRTLDSQSKVINSRLIVFS